MITIDHSNLPRELFAISTARVRAGKGPVRVEPTAIAHIDGGSTYLYARALGRGKATLYSASELFETLADAKQEGLRLAVVEHQWETRKHREICSRLQAALNACED